MTKTFTQNDLVRYIYQETTNEENIEIEKALLFNEQLSADHAELSAIVGALDQCEKQPSDQIIDAVLGYSKSFHLHTA